MNALRSAPKMSTRSARQSLIRCTDSYITMCAASLPGHVAIAGERRVSPAETLKAESVRRQAGRRKRRCYRAGTGDRDDSNAMLVRSLYKAIARVADQRRAGIADERHIFAIFQ